VQFGKLKSVYEEFVVPVPVLLGSPVAQSSNVNGMDDYGDVVGLANGNLAIIVLSADIGATPTLATIELRAAHGFGLLGSAVLDLSATGMTGLPELTALADGSFVVTWSGAFSLTTGGRPVWQQAYDATGSAIDALRIVSDAAMASELGFDVAALGDSSVAIAFEQFTPGTGGDPGSWDVRVRLILQMAILAPFPL
jgi:hypothetical protein